MRQSVFKFLMYGVSCLLFGQLVFSAASPSQPQSAMRSPHHPTVLALTNDHATAPMPTKALTDDAAAKSEEVNRNLLHDRAAEAIARDQSGGTLTPADKSLIEADEMDRMIYRSPETLRGMTSLDDNGGATFVKSDSVFRIPPTGTGGSGTDTVRIGLAVSGMAGYTLSVEVEIDSLIHTFDGDLDIFLRAPTGTQIELSTDNGSSGDNMIHTRFAQGAATAITAATAPMTGTYRPEGTLNAFNTQDPNGLWTLLIYDDAGGDTGRVYSWRIQVLASSVPVHDFATLSILSPTSPQAPGSVVPVTAVFKNLGLTTEGSPVSYSFNGNAAVNGSAPPVPQNGVDTVTFGTQLTLPMVGGNYPLKVWTGLATDLVHANDTITTIISVLGGFDCDHTIVLAGVRDSAAYNNCGTGDTSPGQSCGYSRDDMVFSLDVPSGMRGSIWQSSNTFDSRHSLRWGGACPGTTLVGCIDDPDVTQYSWANTTGVTQTLYFVVGGYSSTTACGDFMLQWSVQPPPQGETCANALALTVPTPGIPTMVSGNLADYGVDCPDTCDYISSSPDVFYSLTLSSCRRIVFSLEDTQGGSGDMHLTVYESLGQCCGPALLCDDDRGNFDTLSWELPGQRGAGSLSSFAGGELPAGTYFIRVGHFSSTASVYLLTVYDNGPCGCEPVACQGGDVIEAAEDRYAASFAWTDPDGGCGDSVVSFGALNCGATLCGVGFTYQPRAFGGALYRDTDWLNFTVSQTSLVTLTLNAGFPALFGFIDADTCSTAVLLAVDSTLTCLPGALVSSLDPGTYTAFVAPLHFVGNPVPTPYRASLTCVSACQPDTVTDLVAYAVNQDGGGTFNDILLRWNCDPTFTGTYTIYYHTIVSGNQETWTQLTSGIAPNPVGITYYDLNAVDSNARRFYMIIGVCP